MAQQQARRDDDQFKNLDRTDDQEIQDDGDVGKNSDQVFGTTGGTATDPVAVYAYESSTVGGVPAAGAGGMPAADYRYEYTAVYETTTVPTAAHPGFGVGAGGGGGGGFGQQANADLQGAGGGDKTGGSRNRNMNMNMDRDQK